ncbi:hypothetical protein Bccel_4882 [Pseudobacteroides cellulosolvens ATCC 35603 = DSM 2933]|uniref:GCN5-related N-acetyltransferase n=1 Tax=Pseudobacteroides cellulosolvens ATCC 35603 = DSM 2933 TaxID=398512 RepID=A0A0L6JUV3_9FIRM|nr:hypothetical protein Bccel_4882 [Pseudobacteroides cellulosolvens ATCC 35603 = DSM 2933]
MFKLRCAKKEEYDFLYNLLDSTIKKYYVETFGSWD